MNAKSIAKAVASISPTERQKRVRSMQTALVSRCGRYVLGFTICVGQIDDDGYALLYRPRLADRLNIPNESLPDLLGELEAVGAVLVVDQGPDLVRITFPCIAEPPARLFKRPGQSRPDGAYLH